MQKNNLFILLLTAVLTAVWAAPACATPQKPDAKAILRVVIDGSPTTLSPAPELRDGEPYLPLRMLCDMFGGLPYWFADKQEALVVIDGETYTVSGYIKADRLMVALADLCDLFGISVEYDKTLNAAAIYCGMSERLSQQALLAHLPDFEGYNEEDLYWLSRIVEAEATGESYESRLAVANVILNRLNDNAYPDTIKAVIFDKKFGVQFTPTANGSVYNEPTTMSTLAALDALEGRNNAPDALFFMNPRYATSFWMQENRQYAFTIGGHEYYY